MEFKPKILELMFVFLQLDQTFEVTSIILYYQCI
jgi:hypothetical protein